MAAPGFYDQTFVDRLSDAKAQNPGAQGRQPKSKNPRKKSNPQKPAKQFIRHPVKLK